MDIGIVSIGTAVPKYTQNQSKMLEFMLNTLSLTKSESRLLKAIYQSTGIENRHSVLEDFTKLTGPIAFFSNEKNKSFPSTKDRMQIYKKNALPLAVQAIENCFKRLEDKYTLSGITHLITVSCTGMYAPGLDIELVQHLGLPFSTHRTTINFMGCYGVFNAIKSGYAICTSNPDAKVLIVSVELCSLHLQEACTMDHLISSAIFADGASALLMQANPSQKPYLKCNEFYCDLIPEGSSDMTWEIADQGFDIMLSSYVPALIEKGIKALTQKLPETFKRHHFDFFAIHPGSKKILEASEKALGIEKEDNIHSYDILQKYGNMSSATILFILKNILESSILHPMNHLKKIFCCAFGPGLTIETMSLSIQNLVNKPLNI